MQQEVNRKSPLQKRQRHLNKGCFISFNLSLKNDLIYMNTSGAESSMKRLSLRPRGNLFTNFSLLKSNNSRSSHRNTPKNPPPPRGGARGRFCTSDEYTYR